MVSASMLVQTNTLFSIALRGLLYARPPQQLETRKREARAQGSVSVAGLTLTQGARVF